MYIITFLFSCSYLESIYYFVAHYYTLKPYVIKNVTKSAYLFLLFIFSSVFIIPSAIYGDYNNTLIKICGSLYVSNDFCALFHVKLNNTTKFHHIATSILLFYSWTIDFNENHIAKLIFLYTYISSANFGVNLFLGLRFFDEYKRFLNLLKNIIKHIYFGSFVVNVLLQIYFIDFTVSGTYIYSMLISLIIVDDIYLLKWLYN